MMRSMVAVGFAALLVVGCVATVPMTSDTDDATARRFEPAAPDQAALYLYRESMFNAGFTLSLSIGQRTLGPLAANTFFRIDLPPGQYDVRCIGENTVSVPVSIAAGETRFVEIAPRMGNAGPRCVAAEVDTAKGREAVSHGRRAQEVR